MCRLLAYAAPRDTTVTKVIGDMNSDAFQRMTSVHNDGWGTAWLAAGFGETEREIESLRISTPGQNDPLLSTLLADAPSNARIAHLHPHLLLEQQAADITGQVSRERQV